MTTQTNAAAILVSEIKTKSEELRCLLASIDDHVTEQHECAQTARNIEEMERLAEAEPFKWLDAAKANLQAGIMLAIRAVEQPTEF